MGQLGKEWRTKRYPEAIDKPWQQSDSPTGPSVLVLKCRQTSRRYFATTAANEWLHGTNKEFLLLLMAM